jgi:cyanate permease
MKPVEERLSEFAAAWPVLAAATIGLAIGVHALPFYTAGTFMAPLANEFGWTRAELSIGPMLLTLVLALGAPAVGGIIDRWGDRLLILFSLASLAILVFLMTRLDGDIREYWLLFAAMPLLGAGSGTLAFSRIVSAAFLRQRGTALGIALTGTGVTSALGPAFFSGIIEAEGWRHAYLVMAIIISAMTPFVLFPLWRRSRGAAVPRAAPEDAPPRDGQATFGEALHSSVFWRLAIAFPLVSLSSIGMVVHFVPLLRDSGMMPAEATAMAGLIGLAMIGARLVSGVLIDLIFAPWVASGVMAICATGLALLALDPVTFAWCGAIAVGFAIGIEFDLIAYMAARYFGLSAFGRIYGVLYGLTALGVSASSLAYGYWAEKAGSYSPALFCAAALLLGSILIFMTLPKFLHAE